MTGSGRRPGKNNGKNWIEAGKSPYNHTGDGLLRRKEESWVILDGRAGRSRISPFYHFLHLCAGPACTATKNPTLRASSTRGKTGFQPGRREDRGKTGRNTRPGRPKPAIPGKSDKSGKSDEFRSFHDFRLLLRTFWDSLGVLPGFLAVLARLFPSFRPESVFPRVKTLPQSVILRVFAGGVVTK